MQGLLEGKVAVITGAGSGVGRAASLLFTRHGAKVVAADIDEARIAETVALVEGEGGAAIGRTCNVAVKAEVEALVQAAVDAFGRLDIIYNNAGITVPIDPVKGLMKLIDVKTEDMERVQAVNVYGVIYGCQAAQAQFEKQGGGGVIVSTASVAGLMAYGGVYYGSTKAAITNLTRGLALELAPLGIRINSVCPAGMLTHYAGNDPDGPNAQRAIESMSRAHPLGKPIDPMDCANGALFLCSDLASNITGVNLPIDGGLSSGISLHKK